MTLASYDQILEAVMTVGIEHQQEYESIYEILGGVPGVTAAVWNAVKTFTSLSWDSMKQLVKTALAVPPWMAGKLTAFVEDLFDKLQEIVAWAAETTGEAAEEAAQAGTRIVSKMKKTKRKAQRKVARTFQARTMQVIRKI